MIETNPLHKFAISIKSEGFDEGDGLACKLIFTYKPKYPDEAPIIEIDDKDVLDDAFDKEELLTHLYKEVIVIKFPVTLNFSNSGFTNKISRRQIMDLPIH